MLGQWYIALPIVSVGFAAIFLSSCWSSPSFVHVGTGKVAQQAFARCSALKQKYRVRRFLSSGHVETIFAAFLRKPKAIDYIRATMTGPDGGTTAVDATPAKNLSAKTPIVILLPGMSSSSKDTYVQHLAAETASAGFRTFVLNGRGCGSHITTAQTFSASFTGDMRQLVGELKKQYPQALLFAAGWSLGANILLTYLGEEGKQGQAPLSGAVSLCNPFDLAESDVQLRSGFKKVYNKALAGNLVQMYKKNAQVFLDSGKPFKHAQAANAPTIRAWDDAVQTAAYGWKDVDAYYVGSSSANYVPFIKVPTLCIQAETDPIAPASCIPRKAIEQNPLMSLVVTPAGGHLGWVRPSNPLQGPWTDKPVVEWLQSMTQTLSGSSTHVNGTA